MADRFRAGLRRLGVSDDDAVLVAVSGGLDSMVLFHLFRFAAPVRRMAAAHFDHGMREGSRADADWVRGICRAWAVPLFEDRASPPPRSEADARDRRYAFLDRAADSAGAAAVATGHHADDQAETVLFRLARGTGLDGLAGIAARRGRIVRPLLAFTRRDLLAYARAYRLTWRDDPTNLDRRFARNRIRLNALPVLETVGPGAAGRIAALAAEAAEAAEAWRSVLRRVVREVVTARDDRGFTLARERLQAYHPHVRARVLRHLLRRLGGRPDRSGTRLAVEFINSGASGTGIALAGGVTLSREFERLRLERTRSEADLADVPLEIRSAEAGAGTFIAGGRRYAARWAPAVPGREPGEAARFVPSALRFPLVLRGWRPGDRIRLRFGSRKVKELFRERRVGRSARRGTPVLADAEGRVLWVAGLARADVPRPGAGDPNAFEISVVDGEFR